jgi:C-terminal processing protease CtpA/Prc
MSNRTKCLTIKLRVIVCLALILSVPFATAHGQEKASDLDRERGRIMLKRIKDDLKKNYYDPKFHGVDIEAAFKAADEKLKDARSVGQVFGIIAQVLGELDDSHTFFVPPERAGRTDYGWTMQVVGDRCFVSSVDEGSDAAAKGVKPGDEVLEAAGFVLGRPNLWKFQYMIYALRPQPGISVILRRPNGEQSQLDLKAKQIEGQRFTDLDYNEWMRRVVRGELEEKQRRDRFKSFGDDLLIWKLNDFDLDDVQVDGAMDRARQHKALILDLRGNSGGWVTTIKRILANLFERDVKIGDEIKRNETKPEIAKSRGDKAFTGKVIILVDSRSASASEVLARVVQLEKRGTVIGDQTAGAVMTSRRFSDQVGLRVGFFYGVSITVSDLIMADGKSLEKIGVMPDEVRLPKPEDLAAGRDTVLSYAASLNGVMLDPVEAGKLFPIEIKVKRN